MTVPIETPREFRYHKIKVGQSISHCMQAIACKPLPIVHCRRVSAPNRQSFLGSPIASAARSDHSSDPAEMQRIGDSAGCFYRQQA